MQVSVRLFAGLRQLHRPTEPIPSMEQLQLSPDASLFDLYQRLGLDPHQVDLAIVNGELIHPYARETTTLNHGDSIELWPEVAGG